MSKRKIAHPKRRTKQAPKPRRNPILKGIYGRNGRPGVVSLATIEKEVAALKPNGGAPMKFVGTLDEMEAAVDQIRAERAAAAAATALTGPENNVARDVEADKRALRRTFIPLGTFAHLDEASLGDIVNLLWIAKDVDETEPLERRALGAMAEAFSLLSDREEMSDFLKHHLLCLGYQCHLAVELGRRLEQAGPAVRRIQPEVAS